MKKNKLALLASMGLASLVFLSGCVSVDRKTGNPTGLIWNLLGRPMGEAIKFFANNLGLGFGIGIIIVTLIVRLIILPLGLYQSWKATYQSEKMNYLKPILGPIQERMKNASTQEEKLLAQQLFELAVEVVEKTGVHLGFINLSGGVGVNYKPEQEPNDIAIIGEGVHRVFDSILKPAGLGHVKIYTELGRFMLASHGLLVTRVTHKKKTYRTYVGVDASAVNLLRPAMYGAYHHITNMDRSDEPTEVVDVVGSLCENNDKFAKQRELPVTEIGDLLVIHDTGAHGFSMGYQYNAKLRSAEVLLQEDGQARLIRRAEKPEDYLATLYGFDIEK